MGIRPSCTTENLVRSPSVAGTNGGRLVDDLDDVNTDYAESDVMLGGATTSNSNGSNDRGNGNSKLFYHKNNVKINVLKVVILYYSNMYIIGFK